MTEREIQRQSVQLLRKAGWLVYVFSDRRRAIATGIPDLFIRHTTRKRSAWVEVKRPGLGLRPEQEAFAKAALEAGEEWAMVTSAKEAALLISCLVGAQAKEPR